MHVVGVIFLLRENALQHGARRRILFAEEAYQLAIMLARDAFGNEVFFDHLDEVLRVPVFRC